MALTLKIFTRAEGAARFMGQHELEGARVTIGRSVECTLQLPDPEKKLSRVHVELAQTAGGYRLRVASTHSSVAVNGREYPPGSEVTLRAGDALVMDVYDLDVVSVGTAVREQVAVARAPAPEVLVAKPAAQPIALVRPPGARSRLAKRFGIAAAAIAGVMALLAFWPHSAGRIEDLAYSVKPGGRVDFKGTYAGEPFALVRTSTKDRRGTSVLYLGRKGERLRTTFNGDKRLTEILAMDKGYRFTLTAVDRKRMEYRLYRPDRSFWCGSVLYRAKGRWLLGLLKTEAFAGYEELVGVTDFTEAIARGKLSLRDRAGDGAFIAWDFSLISSARAQDDDPGGPTGEDFDKVVEEQAGPVANIAYVANQERAKVDADIRDANRGIKNPFDYITNEIGNYAKSKVETSLKDGFFDKFKTPLSIFNTVEHVSDNYTFDEPDSSAYAGDGAWKPMEGTGIGKGIDTALGYAAKIRDFIAWGPRPSIDPLDVDSSTSAAPSAPDTSAPDRPTPMQRFKRLDASADEAGRCIRAKDFACAEAALTEMKKNASSDERFDIDLVNNVTDSISKARTEVADAARSGDEAARQALLARDRQTVDATAAATAEIARRDAERRANAPPPSPVRPRPELAQDNSVLQAEERRKVIADFQRTLLDKQTVQQANAETQRSRQARSPFGVEGGFNVAQEFARLSQEEQRANTELNASAGRLRAGAAAAPTSGNCNVSNFSDQLVGVAKPGDIQCMTQYENAESLRQQAIANCRAGDLNSANTIYKDRYTKILSLVRFQCTASSASTSVPAQGRAPTAPPAKPVNRPVTAPAVKPCVSDGHATCVRPI